MSLEKQLNNLIESSSRQLKEWDEILASQNQRLVKINRRLKMIDIETNVLLNEAGLPHSPIIEDYIY